MWESLEPDLAPEPSEASARRAVIALIVIALLLLGAFALDDTAGAQLAVQSTGEKQDAQADSR